MKTLVAALTLAILLGGHLAALGITSEEEKIKNQKNREILTIEEDKLFKEGRLHETVVMPIYNSAEQLFNTELIKMAENREILTTREYKLFKEGRLHETVIMPIYNSAEQLFNTELMKMAEE